MDNLTVDYSWQKNAVCAGMDSSLFFLSHGQKIKQEAVDACSRCPVKEACLDHSLKYEEYGYWGNTTPLQRVQLRKERGIIIEDISFESQKIVDKEIEKIADEVAKTKIQGRGRKPAECGTRSGYNAHLRRKKTDPTEIPCDACKKAQNDAMIITNLKKKAKSNAR
jgi:hypothetical protein